MWTEVADERWTILMTGQQLTDDTDNTYRTVPGSVFFNAQYGAQGDSTLVTIKAGDGRDDSREATRSAWSLQAEEGRLTVLHVASLVATAVPSNGTRWLGRSGPGTEVSSPGVALHRLPGGFDLLAAGVGPALAAASTAAALTAAALGSARPYGLVVSAPVSAAASGGRTRRLAGVADEITAADLGAETADGFLPVTDLGFGTASPTGRPPASSPPWPAATGARPGTVLTGSTVTGTAERAALLRDQSPARAGRGHGGLRRRRGRRRARGCRCWSCARISNPVGSARPRRLAHRRLPFTALTDAFGSSAPVLTSWNRHDR